MHNTSFNLENFMRASQYFATVPSNANYYQEMATVLRQFFQCDIVYFIKKEPDAFMRLPVNSGRSESIENLLDSAVYPEVLQSGFMQIENVTTEDGRACTLILLPVNIFHQPLLIMSVGLLDSFSPEKEALNILLTLSIMLGNFLEKQHTESSYERLLKEHKLILESAGEGIIGIDRDGIQTFVNPAAAKMLGYNEDAMVGHNAHEQWHYKHQDGTYNDIATCKIHNTFALDESISGEDYFIRADKSCINVEYTSSPLLEEDRLLGAVVTFKDISPLKKAQYALQQAHDRLEEKVKERTLELSQANEKLKEIDKLKSMFIASMSHELRTPLNSIIGFSTVLLMGQLGTLSPKQKDYLLRVKNSGNHLLALITDVIDISKIEAGHIRAEPTQFQLCTLIDDAIVEVTLQAQKKSIQITAECDSALTLCTDKRRLLQCLLNFLSNAVKYSDKGEIRIAVEQEGDAVKILVTDQGIGIRQEDQTQVFEAFERFESHLKVQAGGSGLGLYLTKKITEELLKGTIGFQSIQNRGSTFWIKIPVKLSPL